MNTSKPTSADYSAACRLIEAAHRVVVFTHMSPDGDAMGSSLGIMHWFREAYRLDDVSVIVPNAFPDFLHWMPGAEEVLVYDEDADKERAENRVAQADLLICTDFGEVKRVGLMAPLFGKITCPILVIDHHLQPSDFAQFLISCPSASSASELVLRLILESGKAQAINLQAATCLYTGLMTDTGNFSYNSNDPEVYELVAELLRRGVNKDAVYDAVYNVWSEDRLRLMGYCMHRKLQIIGEHKHIALICLSRKEMYRFNVQSGDTEGLVNLPLQMKQVHYSCLMRADKDKIKISFRSQGNRPVNILARDFFNGGGHANAAGGEFYGSLDNAAQLFLQHCEQYFNLP